MWGSHDLDELRAQKDAAWRKQKRLKAELDDAWRELKDLERSHQPEIDRLQGKPGKASHRRRLINDVRRARNIHREILAEYRAARDEFLDAKDALHEGIEHARDSAVIRTIFGTRRYSLFGELFRRR